MSQIEPVLYNVDGLRPKLQINWDWGSTYLWAEYADHGVGTCLEGEFPNAPWAKQMDAEIWMNPGTATSISEILSEDERYGVFKALQDKEVYSNSKQIIETGANGYWETGPLNPHLVLTDLINILHPELLPDYESVYYEKLKE